MVKIGEFKIMLNGDCFVVFDKGCCYEGMFGKFDYCIVEFDKYGVKVVNKLL